MLAVLRGAPYARALLFLLMARPVVAQTDARACDEARRAERTQHADNLAAINKRVVDVNNQYNKDHRACSVGRPSSSQAQSCRRAAMDKRETAIQPVHDARSDEMARHTKANIDIVRGACTSRPYRVLQQKRIAARPRHRPKPNHPFWPPMKVRGCSSWAPR